MCEIRGHSKTCLFSLDNNNMQIRQEKMAMLLLSEARRCSVPGQIRGLLHWHQEVCPEG